MTGTIAKLNLDAGSGTISAAGESDVCFNRSVLDGLEFDDSLVGRRVEFNFITNEDGKKAISVRAVK